ncbi:MAG: hypothetical protein LBV23_07675 [Deltaproteobacteria bacterium]|jgi:hypothetical protein|nr:hypothetical protein [Deltaproteobacteria bacterium]
MTQSTSNQPFNGRQINATNIKAFSLDNNEAQETLLFSTNEAGSDILIGAQQTPMMPIGKTEPYKRNSKKSHESKLSRLKAFAANPNLTPLDLGEGKIAFMPNGGKNSPEQIQTYVAAGTAIFEKIQDGYYERFQQHQLSVGEDEIALVIWYLQALAASKAAISVGEDQTWPMEFKEGALLIEDRHYYFEHFLRLANCYSRPSEHFRPYQTSMKFKGYGLDVRSVHMPYDRRSVLFQRLPDDAPVKGARFLYIKTEPFGNRWLSGQGAGRSVLADKAPYLKPNSFLGEILRLFSNLGETIGRAFSLDAEGPARRKGTDNLETVPRSLIKNFKHLITALKNEAKDKPKLVKIVSELERAEVDSQTGGVHLALKAVSLAEIKAYALALYDEGVHKFLKLLTNFYAQTLNTSGDHPRLRFGREVILTTEEFGPIYPRLIVISEEEAQGDSLAAILGHIKTDDDDEWASTLDSSNCSKKSQICKAVPSPRLVDLIEAALAQFKGNLDFIQAVKQVMSQSSIGQLREFNDYHLIIQTDSVLDKNSLFTSMEFTLTRILPQLNQELPAPLMVEYDFLTVGYTGARSDNLSGQEVKEQKMKFRLTHYTKEGKITARLVEFN